MLCYFRKNLVADKRSEPRIGERVPYVVVHGLPGTPLYQLIRNPGDVLNDSSLKLNGVYYITKLILPALNRMFSLLGVNVYNWYRELPRQLSLFACVDQVTSYGIGKKKVSFVQKEIASA